MAARPAAGGGAAMALLVTHISAAIASLVWMVIEWRKFGRPLWSGLLPAWSQDWPPLPRLPALLVYQAALIGLAGGYLCYVAVDIIRNRLHIDDSLMFLRCMVWAGLLATCWSRYWQLTAFPA